MHDLIQWALMTDAGHKTGWIVMGLLMLSLVWMHVMWFFKRPIWKSISESPLFAIYIVSVTGVTLLALFMTGIVNMVENGATKNGNPILILYMFVEAPIMIISVLVVGYYKLLKVREKIPEA